MFGLTVAGAAARVRVDVHGLVQRFRTAFEGNVLKDAAAVFQTTRLRLDFVGTPFEEQPGEHSRRRSGRRHERPGSRPGQAGPLARQGEAGKSRLAADVFGRELIGSLSGEKDMRSLLHQLFREADGRARRPQRSNGAGPPVSPAHNRRVQLNFARSGQSASTPGVEAGIFFQNTHRSFDRVHGLLEQAFIHDTGKSVAQAVKEAEGKVGGTVKIAGFVRYALGEGIEKQESDFAAEVAAASGRK